MGKILVVDDEEEIQGLIRKALVKNGHRVLKAGNGKKAIQIIRKKKPDLVLLDLKLPDIDGHKILKKIKEIKKSIFVVIITGYETPKSVIKARRYGAYDYIAKPFHINKIRKVVNSALKNKKIQKDNKRKWQAGKEK